MTNILIADDIKLVSLHLKKILQHLKYHNITITESTDETFNFLSNQNTINLLFLSDSLVGSHTIPNSIQLSKKVLEDYPHLKIVIITNHGKKQTILKFVNHGIKDYIEKPLNINKIKTMLNKLNIEF